MIIDTAKFIREEEVFWKELEKMLDDIERTHEAAFFTPDSIKRLHYLYGRVSDDLVKITTLSGEREVRRYLESLTSRAYSCVHSRKGRIKNFGFKNWIVNVFPRTFRKNIGAFYVSLAATLVGVVFGGVTIYSDGTSREAIFPQQFAHLNISPEERVRQEETRDKPRVEGRQASFASYLISNNIKVSINAFAFGIVFGLGSILMLFYNGIILGAVAIDYILAGQTYFLLGWLLPHGVIEIPAILIAGQAGIILGRIVLLPVGMGKFQSLRVYASDMTTLLCGCALLLVWAGIIESFFSQYHWPVIPYGVKIAFGCLELTGLILYLFFAGNPNTSVKKTDGAINAKQ